MRPCDWCGAPATTQIEIEPPRFGLVKRMNPKTGRMISARVVVRRAIIADACAVHAEVRDRAGGTVMADERKRAVKVDQLSLGDE